MKPYYETERLLLRPSKPAYAAKAADYYKRNRDFLAPCDPGRSEAFYTPAYQRMLLKADVRNAREDISYRFWVALKKNPGTLIGTVMLSCVVRGAFLSCFLGYKLDAEHTGRGYMTEAVRECARFAFAELGLHRIEANIMPRNTASLRVAEKAGFSREGISPQYLKINGVWEDHVHMVLLNEGV